MLGCLAQVSVIVAAIGAGTGNFSGWWLALPIFLSGSFGVANSPSYDIVVNANRRGDLWVLPRQLAMHITAHGALGVALFSLTRWLSS